MTSFDPDINTDPAEDLVWRLGDAESRLAGLTREVEHLQRLATIGLLAAGVVHEINNQLTPALAQAQIARLKPNEPERLLKAVDHCIRGITRGSRIAETLIDFATPDADGQGGSADKPHPGCAANIVCAVKAAISCMGTSSERAAVRIETEVSPGTWAAVDPLALQQILVNLLLNSTKALRETRDPMIRISTTHIDERLIEIVVEDNGPGIPQSIRDNLFSPFVSSPVSKESTKGTGLGLAVSRRLVQRAGGSITAGASKWGGARFALRLPSIASASRAKSA